MPRRTTDEAAFKGTPADGRCAVENAIYRYKIARRTPIIEAVHDGVILISRSIA